MDGREGRGLSKWAVEYALGLRGDDARFKRVVMVVHRDGSVLWFRHAFVMAKGEYMAVFAEHHGPSIYHCEDAVVRQYREASIEEAK